MENEEFKELYGALTEETIKHVDKSKPIYNVWVFNGGTDAHFVKRDSMDFFSQHRISKLLKNHREIDSIHDYLFTNYFHAYAYKLYLGRRIKQGQL